MAQIINLVPTGSTLLQLRPSWLNNKVLDLFYITLVLLQAGHDDVLLVTDLLVEESKGLRALTVYGTTTTLHHCTVITSGSTRTTFPGTTVTSSHEFVTTRIKSITPRGVTFTADSAAVAGLHGGAEAGARAPLRGVQRRARPVALTFQAEKYS